MAKVNLSKTFNVSNSKGLDYMRAYFGRPLNIIPLIPAGSDVKVTSTGVNQLNIKTSAASIDVKKKKTEDPGTSKYKITGTLDGHIIIECPDENTVKVKGEIELPLLALMFKSKIEEYQEKAWEMFEKTVIPVLQMK